jgi:hypothetical protein
MAVGFARVQAAVATLDSGSKLGRGYVPLFGSAILIGGLICSFGEAAGMGPRGGVTHASAPNLSPGSARGPPRLSAECRKLLRVTVRSLSLLRAMAFAVTGICTGLWPRSRSRGVACVDSESESAARIVLEPAIPASG